MESNHSESPFSSLPVEVLLGIFFYLDTEDVVKMGITNHFFHQLSKDNVFWKKQFEQEFPNLLALLASQANQGEINWFQDFRKAYLEQKFPNLLALLASLANQDEINWFQEFRKAYQEIYLDAFSSTDNKARNIREIAKCFSLVKRGAEPALRALKLPYQYLSIKDGSGYTLLEWAQIKKDQPILDYIYEIVSKEPNLDKNTLFSYAISCNQSEETLQTLLDQGADIEDRETIENPRQTDKLTYLFIATRDKNIKIVNFLLDKSADKRASLRQATFGSKHESPLSYAVKSGDLEMLDLFIKRGASINSYYVTPGSMTTLIHHAANHGQVEVVKYLLEKGATLPTQTTTLLHAAAAKGHIKLVEYLIEQGHDINAKAGILSNTPLSTAISFGHLDIVKVLLAHGAKFDQDNYYHLSLAATKDKLSDIVRYVVDSAIAQEGGNPETAVQAFLNRKDYRLIGIGLQCNAFKHVDLSILLPHREAIQTALFQSSSPEFARQEEDMALSRNTDLATLLKYSDSEKPSSRPSSPTLFRRTESDMQPKAKEDHTEKEKEDKKPRRK